MTKDQMEMKLANFLNDNLNYCKNMRSREHIVKLSVETFRLPPIPINKKLKVLDFYTTLQPAEDCLSNTFRKYLNKFFLHRVEKCTVEIDTSERDYDCYHFEVVCSVFELCEAGDPLKLPSIAARL